jgi:hypothetical protein
MTKYPRLAAVCFGIAIALAATPSAWATDKPVMAVKPPAPQQPINPGVVLAQPVTLKPALNLSNYNPSTSYSNSQASASNRAQATGGAAYSSVSIEADQRRLPVATATAPALAASTGTCMGSSSAGAQGAALGLSFGTTWTDAECDRRHDSIRLQQLGMTEAAMLLMCNKASVREAMDLAGTPCPQPKGTTAEAQPVEPTDPIVRRRLGLAPL